MKISNLTTNQIWSVLDTVIDPETHLSIVAMGLVYAVEIQPQTPTHPDRIYIQYTLTTPLCPLAGVIEQNIRKAIGDEFKKIDFDISSIFAELVFTPVWTTERLSEEAKAELGF